MRMFRLLPILTLLLGFTFVSYAQKRSIDLEVVLSKPDSGYCFISPGFDTVAYYIVNHGPDTVYSSDGYLTRVRFDYTIINPKIDYVGSMIVPGDSLLMQQVLVLDYPIDRPSIVFCVTSHVYASDKPAIYIEQDSTELFENNKFCTKMAHKRTKTGSVNNLGSSEIALFPNPSIGAVRIESIATIFSVSVINSLGQEVYAKENINATSANFTLDEYTSGIYFVSIKTARGTQKIKMILSR